MPNSQKKKKAADEGEAAPAEEAAPAAAEAAPAEAAAAEVANKTRCFGMNERMNASDEGVNNPDTHHLYICNGGRRKRMCVLFSCMCEFCFRLVYARFF